MPAILTCPQCRHPLRVADDLLGKKVKCPLCGSTFLGASPGAAGQGSAARMPSAGESIFEPVEDEEPPSKEVRDRPERPRRRYRGKPHRGTLILILGLAALTPLAFVCGPMAWAMGNADLQEMNLGRMDREGEMMTKIGRVLGMIGTIFAILGVVCGLGAFLFFLKLGRDAAMHG
ncbi:MAG TPA: hypothetical protein VNK04_06640 [Gemmataceae bacterium]|nr:hypothetical protein [Gemmataceae bacterium]